MAINTWKLWEKIGFKHREIEADIDTDISAANDYLKNVYRDAEDLQKLFSRLIALRKEAKMLTDDTIQVKNMRAQIELYDKLLQHYEDYYEDAGINAIRVKKVAKDYLGQAQKFKLYDILDKIKKELHWMFDW